MSSSTTFILFTTVVVMLFSCTAAQSIHCSGCSPTSCPENVLCDPSPGSSSPCKAYYNYLTVVVELDNKIQNNTKYYGFCIRVDEFAQLSIMNGIVEQINNKY